MIFFFFKVLLGHTRLLFIFWVKIRAYLYYNNRVKNMNLALKLHKVGTPSKEKKKKKQYRKLSA